MFSTILVAVDGSGHASRAVSTAIDLATRYDAGLVVTHVVSGERVPDALVHMARIEHLIDDGRPSPGAAATAPFAGMPGLLETRGEGHYLELERLRKVIAEHLTGIAERDARDAGIEKVATEVLEGEPVAELLASIERHGADLVVLGSRGLSDLKGLLLGSVSHKICQLAPCTCVTVK